MEGPWRKNKSQNKWTSFMDFSFGKFTSIILVTLSKPLCNIVLNLLTCFYKIIIHITYFWNTWCFLFLSITHYNAYFKDNYLHNHHTHRHVDWYKTLTEYQLQTLNQINLMIKTYAQENEMQWENLLLATHYFNLNFFDKWF